VKLPRQPEKVRIHFTGDKRDVDYYIKWINQVITNGSYAHVVRQNNVLVIYPGAVND
jgi:hypothetical protein